MYRAHVSSSESEAFHLSVSQVALMKRWCQVHTHRLAIKVGPKRETVPSPTEQEQLRFFWVCDLRAERVQHQRPGYGILERPEHKRICYQTSAKISCRTAYEL